MKINKRVARAIKILLFTAVFIVLLQAVLGYLKFTFSSDLARRVLVEQIKTVTQRDVRIDGDVLVTVSLLPQLHVERIHVLNEEVFGEQDFITISEARVRISLVPLLGGNLVLDEIAAAHAHINLIRRESGDHNWSFDHLTKPPTPTEEADGQAAKAGARRRVSLNYFDLTDITVNYSNQADQRVIVKRISSLLIDLEDRTKPLAAIAGSLDGYSYDMIFESGPLENIVLNKPWRLLGTGTVWDRKAEVEAELHIKDQDIAGYVDLDVQEIDLGHLLEDMGIIAGEEIAAENLKLNATFHGRELSEIIERAALEMRLEKGSWRWRAPVTDEIREVEIDEAVFNATLNQPLKARMTGKLFEEIIRFDLVTNSLAEFLEEPDRLDVDLSAHAADSDISLKGALDLPATSRQFRLDVSIKGRDLEKLNRLLVTELPPFNNYRLAGSISSNETAVIIKFDDATIGDTHFRGVIIIDTSSMKPIWIVNLDSEQLQIRDFEFADGGLGSLEAETTKPSMHKQAGSADQQPGHRLKQIVDDPAAHFELNVKADRVLAGETALGGFSLKLKLLDDALILQEAVLDVPGGRIEAAASFQIENEFIKGSLKLDVDKFESGVVAGYFTEGTREGGLISARVDLQLGGRDFDRLLDQATGKLDVALWPKNISTGILDLWATNLFLVILPEIRKKESRMNCLVALMDLEDGIMKEDFIGIDTTKVWMNGNISVDFPDEHVILSLYPRSKKAKLFAVQAPIRAEGSFDDIRLITNPVDIAAAYVSFITSPLHVPARWVFGDKVPEDASATCEKFYDREYIKQLKAKLEAEEQKEIDDWLESD